MSNELIPTPNAITKDKTEVYDLKKRLDWGEPALTIVDVRDRDAFNTCHIMGAISMPLDEVVKQAQSSLENVRDIYVYSDIDEETAEAVGKLRESGFENVSQIIGGLGAWKAADYPIE
ncbi:MAG: rhodanese-like domain-containing protein [Microcoleaceae cyanobacterium]